MAAQISFERPFKYPFQDPNWTKKVLMGGLISLSCLVFVGIFVLAGYQKRLFLTLIKDENATIPDIEFGRDLNEGLGAVAVSFLWGLILFIPMMILSFIPVIGQLAGIAMSMIIYVALMHYFVRGDFGAAFEFKVIADFVQKNFINLALFAAIMFLAQLAAGLGVIACFIGLFFTAFLALLVNVSAMASVWRAAQQGEPVPVPVPAQTDDTPPAP